MSKKTRLPAVPIITNDPYFSVWSPTDKLNDSTTINWTGKKQPILGSVVVDGKELVFLGKSENIKDKMEQVDFKITPTSTFYKMQGENIELEIRFTSPLILTNPDLISRPSTYFDFSVKSLDGKEKDLQVKISFDQAHCYDKETEPMIGGKHEHEGVSSGWMGKKKQSPLNHSGDDITIDWGYLYLSTVDKNDEVEIVFSKRVSLDGILNLNTAKRRKGYFIVSYDDIAAINYFGDIRPAYWAKDGKTILTAIEEAADEHNMLLSRCDVFNQAIIDEAKEIGGQEYADIVSTAYRQTIAAHKLITDKNGDIIFLSKENDSNGCIGTVDVSYPSTPIYLMYNTELVKGMLRPIFKFSKMPVWEYDFAPHDVGRYPYATGQVYGASIHESKDFKIENGDINPPFYAYPKTKGEYLHHMQMPVEECGNMLIMTAATALVDGDIDFYKGEMDLLEKWVAYLIEHGENPGNQLCTDDFAGHMSQNINLSAKAIMGVESYSILLSLLGRYEESDDYHIKAKKMAKSWEERASVGEHTALTFEKNGWSLKYNLIWDILFDSQLFSKEIFSKEVAWYIKNTNKFGTPLDTRNDYTKSDWILWVATFTESQKDFKALVDPVYNFLLETKDRFPFSDWYDTKTGDMEHFKNRTVQGGLFMPMLRRRWGK